MPTVLAIAAGVFTGLLLRLLLLMGMHLVWPNLSSSAVSITLSAGLLLGIALGILEARDQQHVVPTMRARRIPFAGGFLVALTLLTINPSFGGIMITLAVGIAALWAGFSWASWFFSRG